VQLGMFEFSLLKREERTTLNNVNHPLLLTTALMIASAADISIRENCML